ncbi:MAG: NAD(P)H-hydrate dehydratase [Proteobacteria bacterium]|nr:NAD(P)H-hydrate dehydratase [Pseudomonadota bacterium]
MPEAVTLFDVHALRAIEARAAQRLGDRYELMRRAGLAAWHEALRLWPRALRILVVCGPGNNGGDGYLLAGHARAAGRSVNVLRLPQHAPRGALAERACAEYQAAGGDVSEFGDALPATDLLVDALFGIGLSRPADENAARLIEAINRQHAPVLALDAPSGVDARSGARPGAAVCAEHTLEFIAAKAGLRTGAALDCTGSLAVADLDLAPDQFTANAGSAECWTAQQLAHSLPRRLRDSHKGANGRVLCVGGSLGHGGAIMLAAEAALRSGAGLVEVVTRSAHVAALLARRPEAMVHGVDDHPADVLGPLTGGSDVIALGPGLGQGCWGQDLWSQALQADKPLVLDADALNLLAQSPRVLAPDTILTPHPGEAARLLGSNTAGVQADRFAAAHALCQRYGCVVVLKGAGSIIAAPDRMSRLIAAGNPGMAVAGMGDVLTGVIAALRAQGLAAFDAASVGALLHAVAGDRAAADGGMRGLLSGDLMPWLRHCANPDAPA